MKISFLKIQVVFLRKTSKIKFAGRVKLFDKKLKRSLKKYKINKK